METTAATQFNPSDSVERYGLKQIKARHREAARRLALGIDPALVRVQLGFSTSRFSIIMNTPLFQEEVKRLMEIRDLSVKEIKDELLDLAPEAVGVLVEVMTNPDEKTSERRNAAVAILDRAGITPPRGPLVQVNNFENAHPVDMSKYRTEPPQQEQEQDRVIDTEATPIVD